MDLVRLKANARKLHPTVRVGKAGLSSSAIKEIKKQLKAKKLVKIKFLGSFMDGKDKRAVIKELLAATGSALVEKKGFIITIYNENA